MEYLTSADCAKKWNFTEKSGDLLQRRTYRRRYHDGKNVDDS